MAIIFRENNDDSDGDGHSDRFVKDEALQSEIKKQFQLRQNNSNNNKKYDSEDEIRANNSFVKALQLMARKFSSFLLPL